MTKTNILIILSFVLLFSMCKKGKDDKFSLRTRDHRVVGTWKLVSGTIVTYAGDKIQTNFYSENSVTFSGDEIYNTNMTTDNSLIMKIKKDGKTELTFDNSFSYDSWHWINTDKNKTGISLPIAGIAWSVKNSDFTMDKLTNKNMNLSLKQVEEVYVIINNQNVVRKYGSTVNFEFEKQ